MCGTKLLMISWQQTRVAEAFKDVVFTRRKFIGDEQYNTYLVSGRGARSDSPTPHCSLWRLYVDDRYTLMEARFDWCPDRGWMCRETHWLHDDEVIETLKRYNYELGTVLVPIE